jgi:iron only hydrogenase large subunit-like protein
MNGLAEVIRVDPEKCLNCHACIAACPVKFCNDGSGDSVTVNANLCIGCGSCIAACTHDARTGIDDFDRWLTSMKSGVPMIAISAPAIAANFPGRYLRVHGWLQSLGVADFFDVSFGAELTVKSYLEYIGEKKPPTVIAQPCPAIVSYIELYQPELIPHLAPADSPMVHVMKMIREFYPRYRHHKILVLSPCLAKRREFDAVGLGDFNVTYAAITDHLKREGIDIQRFPEVQFTADRAERAVAFSTPGGLQQTVARENPAAAAGTRKIEGPEIVYDYLAKLPEMIEKGYAPLLIDCLNCEMGCNGGPGTVNQEKSPDEVESHIRERTRTMQKRYTDRHLNRSTRAARRRVRRAVDRHWRRGLYGRQYLDRSENNTIRTPSKPELNEIYRLMLKEKPADFLNCRACGYGSCELMATAIFNGLNRPENCFHYAHASRTMMTDTLLGSICESTERLSSTMNRLTDRDGEGTSVYDIADVSRGMRASVDDGLTYIKDAIETMEAIRRSNMETLERSRILNEQIDQIGDILGLISSVAEQTKIIAFNAELEASSAGDAGQNFVIVAAEIRRLANSTGESTRRIREQIQEIERSSQQLAASRSSEQERIAAGVATTAGLEDVFGRLSEFSADADAKIERTIEAQISAFRQTLGELQVISGQMASYRGDGAGCGTG